ncbi:MAG: hypothetical protein MJ062_01325 [Oscillospiraceae bacterium]|nr:hypothetical protein [Oscillospiraceae bacterium]
MKKSTLNKAMDYVDDKLVLEMMEPNRKIGWHINKTAIGVVIAAELVIAAVGVYALTRNSREIVNPADPVETTAITDTTINTDITFTDITDTELIFGGSEIDVDPTKLTTTTTVITTHIVDENAKKPETKPVVVSQSERYGDIYYNPDLKENYPGEILKWNSAEQKYEIIQDAKHFDHDRTYSREKMVEFVGEVSNEVFDALMEFEQKGSTAALDAVAVEHFNEILGLAISGSQYDTVCSDTVKRVLHCDDLPDGGQALYGAIVQKHADVEVVYESCYEANVKNPCGKALEAIFEEYGFFISRVYDDIEMTAEEKAYLDQMKPCAELDRYSSMLHDVCMWYDDAVLYAEKPQFPVFDFNDWENWAQGTFDGLTMNVCNSYIEYCNGETIPVGLTITADQNMEKVFEKAKKVLSYSESESAPDYSDIQVEIGQKTGQPLQIPEGKKGIARVISDDGGLHGVVEALLEIDDSINPNIKSTMSFSYQYRLYATPGSLEVCIPKLTMNLLGQTIE